MRIKPQRHHLWDWAIIRKKESLGSHAIRLNTAKIDSIQQNRLSSAKCEWSIVKIKKAVPTVARLNFESLRSS